MQKKSVALVFVVLAGLCSCLFFSCSHKLGYSVVLWSSPEQNLYAGNLVRVYIKSNISQVYVVGLTDSKEKTEVPFWQILPPQSKSKVLKQYEPYQEYKNIYAKVVLDGLPVRNEPVNTSRQVYRLRNNEVVKVLYKGEGVLPSAGAKTMEGEWLWILTQDGTTGWCFSYNLRLYDEFDKADSLDTDNALDQRLELVLDKTWYPDSYAAMIASNQIDISQLKKEYCFDTGKESGTVTLKVKDTNASWKYEGTQKQEDNVYSFTGTSLVMTIRDENNIVIQYSDEKGRPFSYNFTTIGDSIENLILAETERRRAVYEQLLEFGTDFSSSNYGTLQFLENGTFIWSGYQRLVPDVIAENSGTTGTIEFCYFLDDSIRNAYDGVITFVFDRSKKRSSFMYKMELDGLRFEETTSAVEKNAVFTQRGSNALVLYFGRN